MARLPVLACLTILTMYGAAGRELQQAAGNVQPTSLAAVQNSNAATNNLNTQRAISNSNTGTVTATAIQPTGMQKRTLDQVNADAPVYTDPTTNVAIRPVARQAVTDGSTAGASPSSTVNAKPASATVGVVNPYDVKGASPLDKEIVSGDFISQIVGVRIATPFFGTGFNFCVDKYFSSFPKVGIVIPSPVVWLLPEFQDLAATLTTTLSLPNLLPHGAFVTPTSDGFLLNLPTLQPSQIPELGLRYGIQIGQAFGYDFGYGIVRDICFVDFVIV